MKFLLLGTIAAMTMTVSANAAELLTNGSFEAPDLGTGNYTYPAGTLAGWNYTGAALVDATNGSAWYGSTPPAGQDGGQFASLQTTGSLSQSFTASNSKATVSWLAAGRPDFGSYGGNQNYTVTLGANVLGTFSVTDGQAFGNHSFTVTGLTAGQNYTVAFQGLVGTSDESAFIDRVSVLGVPEPSQWALMIGGFGLVGLGARRRRSTTVFA